MTFLPFLEPVHWDQDRLHLQVDHLDVQFRHYDFDGSGTLDLEVPELKGRRTSKLWKGCCVWMLILISDVLYWHERQRVQEIEDNRGMYYAWDMIPTTSHKRVNVPNMDFACFFFVFSRLPLDIEQLLTILISTKRRSISHWFTEVLPRLMKRISKEVGIKVYIIRAKVSLRYIFHSLSLPWIDMVFAFSAVGQVFCSPILASGLPSDITGGEEYFGWHRPQSSESWGKVRGAMVQPHQVRSSKRKVSSQPSMLHNITSLLTSKSI